MPYVSTAILIVDRAEEELGVTTWAEVESAIHHLAEHGFGRLLLFGDRRRKPAVMMIELDAQGGETAWSCHVHRAQWSHVLLNPRAEQVQRDGVRLPLELVTRAAKEFFETGKRKRSLTWGLASKPLLEVLARPRREG